MGTSISRRSFNMKLLAAVALVAVLLPLALAFDCPEEYTVITTPIITTVPAVATWEDCGRICTQSSVCIFWSWDSYRLNCDLKESDSYRLNCDLKESDGAIIAEDY